MKFLQKFTVVPLSQSNYQQILSVALTIFKSDPNSKEWIPNAYQKAVFPERYIGETNTYAYWALLDNDSNKFVGVTGIYSQNKDRKECFWLGWFGILPEYRGKSLGLSLFQWTEKEVLRRNKRYLRLQTSTLRYASTAVSLYKKQGCSEFKRKAERLNSRISYESIFMEKRLL